MTRTSVLLPPALLEGLHRLATDRGSTVEELILQACQALLAAEHGEWPPGLLDSGVSPVDAACLREAGIEMEEAIHAGRRDLLGPAL